METGNGQVIPKTVFSVDRKVVTDYDRLKRIIDGQKAAGRKIVMTMGVFDMIHDGHAKYNELAKSFGDVFVVGVDDDELTRKNKGPGRPYDDLRSRTTVLAAFAAVDYIMVRGVNEPDTRMAEIVQPDVLIISLSSTQYQKDSQSFIADMTKRFKDTGLVKEIVALEPQSSTSTSSKLRQLLAGGMKEFFDYLLKCGEEYLNKMRSTNA